MADPAAPDVTLADFSPPAGLDADGSPATNAVAPDTVSDDAPAPTNPDAPVTEDLGLPDLGLDAPLTASAANDADDDATGQARRMIQAAMAKLDSSVFDAAAPPPIPEEEDAAGGLGAAMATAAPARAPRWGSSAGGEGPAGNGVGGDGGDNVESGPFADIMSAAAAAAGGDVDEDLAVMDPNNPLMRRVQDALTKQLATADEQLTLELREKEEDLRKSKVRREQVGVELYALQQQLAKAQSQLESAHQAYGVIKTHREKAEATAKSTRDKYATHRDQLMKQQQALSARKGELEVLSRTLGQIQLFHEEMKGKLSTTRRVTLKAEEDLVKQEAEKRKQDLYIHQLTQRLEALKDQRSTLDAQIGDQKQDMARLQETIQDANTEMEAIVFEKRQLLHQWKSSLISMQRRQDVLGQLEQAVFKEKERLLHMDNELAGFKHALAQVATENETLTMLHDKLGTESTLLSAQIKQLAERRDTLKREYGVVQRSLDACEAELKQVAHHRQSLVNEVNALKKQLGTAQQKAVKVEREIAEQIQHELGLDKSMQGTLKDAKKLTQVIHDKEAMIALTENQVAQTKIEAASMADTLAQRRRDLADLDAVIQAKNGTIEKYELEIRRGNDEMAKKQSEIDLLNKKLNQILQQSTDEAIGPMEATIHNLTKSIAAKEKECWDLQQFWLRNQNELVVTAKKASDLAETIGNLRMRLTILSRKKAMLNQAFDAEEGEIKFHQRNIKALQNDMVKINTLLSRQTSVQADLEEGNLGVEQEFRFRLREAEMEAVRMEQQVRDLQTEKDRALGGLLDMERQIMLWEKKIQLAKETREALDPNIGAQEIKEMTLEIHRMELRLSNLEKLQEKLVTEMEKGVVRRETIALRSKLRGKGYTQATLTKAITDLGKQLKGTLTDLKDLDADTAAVQGALDRVRAQISDAHARLAALRDRHRALVEEIVVLQDTKLAAFTTIAMLQKKAKRYQSVQEGKYAFVKADVGERNAELTKHLERLDKVDKALHTVVADCPHELVTAGRSLDVFLQSARHFVSG
ncbi:Coiled-coil domain-containing protein 40 [Allomyces javanicus]|nr:Coiled-coil domain-containing protein 40 [Allomyces javanicus]